MANRAGFLIKNAADSNNYFAVSAPDAVDFITLGNHKYGVLAGCYAEVPVSNATSIAISGGPDGENAVLCDGETYTVPDAVVPLISGSSANARFDLLVFDSGLGGFRILQGLASSNAVFPEVAEGLVVLYAIHVPAGATSIQRSGVTDKRIMLRRNLDTSVKLEDVLVRNTTADGIQRITIRGSGEIDWGDVKAYRSTEQQLTIDGNLVVTRSLDVQQGLKVTGTIEATDRISGSNFFYGASTPTASVGQIGALYMRNSDGQLFAKKASGWVEVPSDEPPPATIIASLLGTSDPRLGGSWLPLNGTTHPRSTVERIWDVPACASWRNLQTGTMTLPNVSDMVLMQSSQTPLGTSAGSMQFTMTVDNMPSHSHFGGNNPSTKASGAHTHVVTLGSAGDHVHSVTGGSHAHRVHDPGHQHGPEYGSSGYIVTYYGPNGDNIAIPEVGIFPSRGRVWPYTARAMTGISVDGGDHSHNIGSAGGHSHNITFEVSGGHSHEFPPEANVGSSRPIDKTPAHLSVRYYIKV